MVHCRYKRGTNLMELEVGDIITCPSCKKPLMECIEKPTPGMSDYTRCFKNVLWMGRPGDLAECSCGAPFFAKGLGVYVEGKGWTL